MDNALMNIDDLYRLLRADHLQAQGIVDTISEPLIVLDADLCVQSANLSFFETFKVERFETIGRRLHELGDGQWDIPDLRRLLVDVIPRSAAIIDFEVTHDFPGLGPRTMLVTARTMLHPDNSNRTMLLSLIDATDTRLREARKDLLFDELRHRVRNLLAVAQSLVRQASTVGSTAEEFRDVFLSRFRSLVDAHDVAFGAGAEAGLKALVEKSLAPFSAPEVLLEGPADVDLSPSALVSFGLALHEMATNAAKYGALSEVGGRLEVRWKVDEEARTLELTWTESGGPPVSPPSRSGFGSRLIRNVVEHTLLGKVEQTFDPEGLRARLTLPLVDQRA